MTNKAVGIILIICLSTSAQFCRASETAGQSDGKAVEQSSGQASIRIYLPREVTVKSNILTLGQVSIIRGQESLVARASEISLGRISVLGQKVIIDRPTLLSRLACNQIPTSKVTLIGAEKVTIKRQHYVINGSEFVGLANSFLVKNQPVGSACQWHPVRVPKDLVMPEGTKDVKLSPHLTRGSSKYHIRVQIDVLSGDKVIGSREVIYRLRYNCRSIVALTDIPAGQTISPENVKVEETVENYPELADWKSPYGLITRCRIPANTVIRPGMIGPVKPVVIIKRNQMVVIRIERPGLLVTTVGKTMQDGRAGEYIKVRNVDSQRILLAKVQEDGTVEPVF